MGYLHFPCTWGMGQGVSCLLFLFGEQDKFPGESEDMPRNGKWRITRITYGGDREEEWNSESLHPTTGELLEEEK